jgi:diguanylate cyclase (GGDEF)-like protein/PAS domain S-box-containing protein
VDRSGRVIGIVGLLKDITSRRRAEEQLKIQKAYAEGLIDGAPEAIVQVDNDDRVLRVNREFTKLFGYTPEEAEGRMVNDLIVPADKKGEGLDLTRRAAAGERFEVEVRRRTKDGRLVEVSALATPIRTEDGQVGVFAAYRDISDRKKAAEALRESEARFRELADLLPTTIAEADKDRRLVYANKMAFELFGYPEEDFEKGLYLDEVIHPDQRELAVERMAGVLAGETLGPTEYRLISGAGREFPGLVTSAPIWRNGTVAGLRTTVQDLTSQKEAEAALRRSEEKYGTILEDIEDGYYELDLAGNFTYATEVTAKIVGTPRHNFLGTNFSDYCNKDNAEYVFKVYHGVYETGVPTKHVRYEFTSLEGVHKIMEASASLIRGEDGRPVGFRGTIRDMTARIKAEEAVRESEERHRKVLETAPDPMVVRDAEGLVTYINPTFTRVFGWTLEEKQGRRLDNIPKEHMPETLRMRASIENGESFSGIETRRLTKDGRLVDVSVSGAVFFDAQGRRRGSVTTLQDITQRKTAEAELKYVAYHDILTGLPNRKSFYMRLEDILNQSQRRLANDTWALLFLDLDKFKHINDSLGHDVGDGLLKAAARRIKACLRRSDYIFRLGGDEFTIILTNLTHDTDVAKVARKILDSVAKPYSIKGHEFYTAASIGISVFPNDGLDVEILVKNADMAMYVAKEEGNSFRFFTAEMNVKALERIKLEGNLRNAVERGEFLLHYQPLVDESRKIMGMEALIRWVHPELGLIPPARFIGLAEETGVIISIGEWVLRTACARARAWQLLWGRDLYIAVNLSARQFRDPLLVETIRKVLDDTGLRPDLLRLEVTESCVMENPEDAIAKMESLRAIGIRFSIDDFGTGYSSLSYLKRFPIDTLKIDRSFVTDSMENSSDREIIKTIISMARNLHIETVAEGVETAEQQEFLCGQGCSMMQGFYFGRPMPEDEFEDLFEK